MGRVELARLIGDVLREEGQTLSVAESCTGGLVSDRITNVSGSSDYFEGGLVSYSIEAKAEHLGIPTKYIERYGAVSSRVAKKNGRRSQAGLPYDLRIIHHRRGRPNRGNEEDACRDRLYRFFP